MTKKTYRTGDLADLFSVHQNTIRSYVDKIDTHLSEDATAARRKYNELDARIIYTVVKMRDIGISFDDIIVAISEGKIEDSLPEQPSIEAEQARDSVELVTLPRDTLLIEQSELIYKIDTLTKALETTKQELIEVSADRDTIRDTLQTRVIELERELSAAKAQLDIIRIERPSALFWLAVIVGISLVVVLVVLGLTVYFAG